MVIPQFTIRRMFVLVAICGLAFLILYLSQRGSEIVAQTAAAGAIALLSLVVLLAVHIVLFLGAWVCSIPAAALFKPSVQRPAARPVPIQVAGANPFGPVVSPAPSE